MGRPFAAIGTLILAGALAGAGVSGAPEETRADTEVTSNEVLQTLKARPRLIAEHEALVAGERGSIAVTFDIAPKWHLYWTGQNDAGLAPKFELELPSGVSAGTPQWPAPRRDVVAGEYVNYTYEEQLTIIIPVNVEKSVKPGEAVIRALLEWLVCEEACIPEEARVELRVPIVSSGGPAPAKSRDAVRFELARKRHAEPASKLPPDVRIFTSDARGSIVAKGATRLIFLPHESGAVVTNALRAGEAEGDQLTLRLEPPPGHDGSVPLALRGILEIHRDAGAEPRIAWYEIDKPLTVSQRREASRKDQ